MRKSLGDKRREISPTHIQEITNLYHAFTEDEHLKIFDTSVFGYRKITVERPLRLNFQASPERIARLREEKTFANLAEPKKTRKKATEVQPLLLEDPAVAAGRQEQEKILAMLSTLPDTLFTDRSEFESLLNRAIKAANLKLAAPIRKAILSALSERDDTAEICRDKNGDPEPDTQLRDTENVPLTEDIQTFFDREVKPHVPDAWINTSIRDEKDGEVGKVGYEINFNRYFYQYQPPRPLEEIESDIKTLEREILDMLREVAG
jgi:type I restriction enzyme M protein